MTDSDVARRRSPRGILFGSALGAAVLLVAALVVMLNYLAARHYERFDWTESDLYTLSEKTENIIADLDREIDVIVFMDPQNELYDPVRELLSRYAAAADGITVRTVDPVKNLAEAQQLLQEYDIQRERVVVFVSGDDRRIVEEADLAEYDYSAVQMGGAAEMTSFKGEQEFTRAILELVEERKPKLLFTTGHGEARLDDFGERGLSRLQDFLGTDNFDIESWATLGADRVPEGTDLVAVPGPTGAFNEQEVAVLEDFVAGGGRVLLLLDPQLTEASQLAGTGLGDWLAGYGVTVSDAIVVDPGKLLPFFGAETIFADSYGSHPITEALRQARLPVVFALARPVVSADDTGDATVTELVRTSSEGWGETNLAALGDVGKDDSDLDGPVGLGVAVSLGSGTDEGPESEAGEGTGAEIDAGDGSETDSAGARLVVFGDSDFATNSQVAQAGNATLVSNTLNWLVERESHLGIPPKEPEQARLSLDTGQRRLILALVVFGIPGACLVAGIVVTLRRRR